MRRASFCTVLAVLLVGLTGCAPRGEAQKPPEWTAADPTATSSPIESPSPSAPAEPPASPTSSPTPSPKPGPCEKAGSHQLAVETALKKLGGYGTITVDGQQSAADCAAIVKFQKRFGLKPADGGAGPATNGVAQRLAASDPAACGAGSGVVACIDLTNQTTWIMQDGKLAYGPTVTRTGMKGFATRAGKFKIGWRAIKDWSEPYEVWLPYWQSVDGGNGFHETTTYIHHAAIGSHGCINLLHVDAVAYWDRLKVGTPVHAFGHRAGT